MVEAWSRRVTLIGGEEGTFARRRESARPEGPAPMMITWGMVLVKLFDFLCHCLIVWPLFASCELQRKGYVHACLRLDVCLRKKRKLESK